MKLAALITAIAALALARAARAEPPISLGYVNTPYGQAEPRGECSYCQTLTVTVQAEAFAYRADNPIAFTYSMQLTAPCPAEYRSACKPSSNRTVEVGWAPWWSEPETDTLRVWAVSASKRCSPSQTVTLPAAITVACEPMKATTARHHHRGRRR